MIEYLDSHPEPAEAAPFPDTQESACPTSVRLDASFQPVVNMALWQNSVPMLSELSFTNTGSTALAQLTIELESEPPLLRPRSWRLQDIEPGQLRIVTDLDVQLDGPALQNLTEASQGTVRLRAFSNDKAIGEFRQEVRILAHNEWGGARSIPDILAAFVQPNEPAVARIIRQASDILRAAGQQDSMEGYQGNKRRVWEQTQAIWLAICSLDIRYVSAPASFVGDGQRVRTAQQIVSERLATCLDTTLLFASCLEAISLRPLIVLLEEHAFVGLWLSKGDFGVSTVDDAPGIRTRLKLDDLKVFETTLVTHTKKPSFQIACDRGADHLDSKDDGRFEAVIDVHRARQRRILPLPGTTAGASSAAAEDGDATTALPPLEAAPSFREDPTAEEELPALTPASRLKRWRNRLLDLSGRNRLLNLPKSDKQLVAIDCPDPAELENMLASMRGGSRGTPLRFRPWPDLMAGVDPRSAALHRNRLHEDASLAFAREALAKRELMVGRGDATIQTALTEIFRKSRADEQEGGSNTLFLTIGSLWWKPEGKDKPYQAPLILVPVVLERPSVRSGFLLKPHSDESRLNATLLELLKQEFDIRFPVFEGDRLPEDQSGLDVPKIIDIFRAKLRDIPGWEVQDSVALTNLSFTKFLMWRDLEERDGFLRESEVVRRLMDGPDERSPLEPRSTVGVTGGARQLDDMLAAADLICPMEADSSQLRAVARAAAGDSFVLIGPPGTGKSQTITNIIANTLAQGRTVLFVAEKRAALEVVQRRLKQVGLADFCLDLFSSKASKMTVLEQLNRAQLAHEEFSQETWTGARRDIAALRAELNDYVRELHRKSRNGWTPFRAIGTVLRGAMAEPG